MSAIWGKILYNQAIPAELPQKMEAAYGAPYQIDKIQSVIQENAYMGCGIQWITEESKREALPILDKGHHILFTADCFLDNRDELLQELSPDDHLIPDGTLMYLGYLKWGIGCLSHFLGAFSMAVYHFDTQTLYLASDHTSSRCLYYYQDEQGITFSTLLKPFLKVHPEIQKNELYLKDFLLAPTMVPTLTPEDTPYLHVYKMEAAQQIVFTEHSHTSQYYWNPDQPVAGESYHSLKRAEDYGAAFLKLYQNCVTQAIRTNQEVAICMSSGLDSSSVGALAARQLKAKNKNLYSFTYVPAHQSSRLFKGQLTDETEGVLKIAAMYPNIIPFFSDNHSQNAFNLIADELDIFEIPFKAFVNAPSLLEIGNMAKNKNCRILLTGQCGNATVSFGEFQDILYDAYDTKHYLSFLSLIHQYGKLMKQSRKKLLLHALKEFKQENQEQKYGFRYTMSNLFLSSSLLTDFPLKEHFEKAMIFNLHTHYTSAQNYRTASFRRSIYSYLGEIETKSGLKSGLLYRDPTRDPRILYFCHQLPYHYFCYRGLPRWLIRENFQNLLPDELLSCQWKRGIQNADWMLRISENWDSIWKGLENSLCHSSLSSFFCQDAIQDFLSANRNELNCSDPALLKNILFLHIAALFCLKFYHP